MIEVMSDSSVTHFRELCAAVRCFTKLRDVMGLACASRTERMIVLRTGKKPIFRPNFISRGKGPRVGRMDTCLFVQIPLALHSALTRPKLLRAAEEKQICHEVGVCRGEEK